MLVVDNGCRVDGARPDASIAVRTADEITAQGGEALAASADVRNRTEVGSAIESAIGRWGSLDAVVNAAGIIRLNDVLTATDDDWQTHFDVHVRGAYHVARRAIEHWRGHHATYGRIVNFTSAAGLEGIPHMLVYSTIKAAVIGLSQTLAASVPAGVTVNTVYPIGWTRMAIRGSGEDAVSARRTTGDWPTNPLIDPAYTAPLVSYLLSDAAAEINGRLVGNIGRLYTALDDRQTIRSVVSETTVGGDIVNDIAVAFADLGSLPNRWQIDVVNNAVPRDDFPIDELDDVR